MACERGAWKPLDRLLNIALQRTNSKMGFARLTFEQRVGYGQGFHAVGRNVFVFWHLCTFWGWVSWLICFSFPSTVFKCSWISVYLPTSTPCLSNSTLCNYCPLPASLLWPCFPRWCLWSFVWNFRTELTVSLLRKSRVRFYNTALKEPVIRHFLFNFGPLRSWNHVISNIPNICKQMAIVRRVNLSWHT